MIRWANGEGTRCNNCQELLTWRKQRRDKLDYHFSEDGHGIVWKCVPKSQSPYVSYAVQEKTTRLRNEIIKLHSGHMDYHDKQKMLELTYRWNHGEGTRCLKCKKDHGLP